MVTLLVTKNLSIIREREGKARTLHYHPRTSLIVFFTTTMARIRLLKATWPKRSLTQSLPKTTRLPATTRLKTRTFHERDPRLAMTTQWWLPWCLTELLTWTTVLSTWCRLSRAWVLATCFALSPTLILYSSSTSHSTFRTASTRIRCKKNSIGTKSAKNRWGGMRRTSATSAALWQPGRLTFSCSYCLG